MTLFPAFKGTHYWVWVTFGVGYIIVKRLTISSLLRNVRFMSFLLTIIEGQSLRLW